MTKGENLAGKIAVAVSILVLTNMFCLLNSTSEFPSAVSGWWFVVSLVLIFGIRLFPKDQNNEIRMSLRPYAFMLLLPFLILFSVEGIGGFLNEQLDDSEPVERICTYKDSFFGRKSALLGGTVYFTDCPSIHVSNGFPGNTQPGTKFLTLVKAGFFGRPWVVGAAPQAPTQ